MPRYRLFGRQQMSRQQSQPTQQIGTFTELLSLFLTMSSFVMLTFFSATNAEFESCGVPNIRLYGGKNNFDGGLFLQTVDGQWQRLCIQWDYAGIQFHDLDGPVRIAQVICRSLGFRSEKASAIFYEYRPEQLPRTSTDFITTLSLNCQGNESQISECHTLFQEVNVSRLQFDEIERNCYSGIACGDDPQFSITLDESYYSKQQFISFINETRSVVATGSLEAAAFGLKGPVCADQRNYKNQARVAQVACHEMGVRTNASFQGVALIYERLGASFHGDKLLRRNTSCLMPDTVCTGREQSIAECSHRKFWGSTEFSLESSDGWYGEQVLIACLTKSSDGLQLTTGKQLVNRSTGNDSVFIKYGSDWLPVINSSNPRSCRAICNALHKEGPSTAICRTEALIRNLEREGIGYVAFIDCPSDEIDVNNCAHFLIPMKLVTPNRMDSHRFYHVHAQCMPLRLNNTSDFNLELSAFLLADYDRNLTAGCLEFSLESQERLWVSNEISENAQSTAQMTCQRIYPNDETYAAYINLENLDLAADWSSTWGPLALPYCPPASAVVGCKPNAESIGECAIQIAGLSTRSPPALRIICASSKEDVRIDFASSEHGHDGLIMLWLGPYRALVSLDGWSDIAASVACRELHYSNTQTHRAIRKSSLNQKIEWLLTIVNCTGSENALIECKHKWTYASLPFGSYVAGAYCQRTESEVRILPFSNQSNSGYATIETYEGNSTALFYFCSVSEISFASESEVIRTQTNSDIALCRAAGYPRTKNAKRLILPEKDVPKTSGLSGEAVFAFKNFVCHEKDSPLEECSYEWLQHIALCPKPQLPSSTRSLALALRCDEYEFGTMVRLVGGSTPYEGHVEVMYKGEWGAVCDDRFDRDASTVVCRQLFGPSSQGKPAPGSRFVTKNERFLLDEVRCSPEHKTLAECAHNVWGEHDCGPCQQIGVICSKVTYIRQPIATLKTEGGRQQLVCAAEGQPSPNYQWFTTGTPLMATGDRVDVVCQELDTVQYTCNAFNDAGESFVQVILDRNTTCYNVTVGKAYICTSNSWVITLTGVGNGILLLLLLGALWKIFAQRRALQEVRQSDGNERKHVSYIVLKESPSN